MGNKSHKSHLKALGIKPGTEISTAVGQKAWTKYSQGHNFLNQEQATALITEVLTGFTGQPPTADQIQHALALWDPVNPSAGYFVQATYLGFLAQLAEENNMALSESMKLNMPQDLSSSGSVEASFDSEPKKPSKKELKKAPTKKTFNPQASNELITAVKKKRAKDVKKLLESGADPNTVSGDRYSSFHSVIIQFDIFRPFLLLEQITGFWVP